MKSPDKYKSAIKARLKEAIKNSEYPYWKISRLSGVGQTTIDGYLYHDTVPRSDKLAALCAVLEVDPAWVMGLID